MFGYLSRSKRSSLNIDEGGGHSGIVLSLVYLDSCITFHSGGKLTAVRGTDYLKRYTNAQFEKYNSSKCCFQKEGGALKDCPQ